jgi:signal transduction histidine kinase/CheY-like chemotaxis protein
MEGKFAAVFNDISDRKRAEEAVQASERRFDLAMLVKNEGIWDWNLNTGEVYFDARYYLMAGYDVNEFPYQLEEFTKRVHPDDVDAVMLEADKHLKGLAESFRVEFRFRKKNEDYMWIFACGNVVERDEDDRPTRFIGTHQDVTEFKRIRLLDESRLHLLHYSENHTLEELLEETLNVTEKITESKIGFYHFVEDDQVTIHLKSWSTNTKATYCKADAAEMKYKLKDAGVWTDCIRERKTIIHNDYPSLPHRKGLPVGHAKLMREMVVPVIKGDKITAILGVGNKATNYNSQDALTIEKLAELAWDIAERKKLNMALAESQSYLKELNAQKDKFFTIIAHDLRSPFNAILGLSQHLLDLIEEKDYEDIEKIGRVLFQSSERAMNLLMNLLEWARTQTGRIELNPESFSIKDLVEEIVPIFEDIAYKKSVSIESSVNELLSIYADKHMIETVLRNLINNAVKYTSQNGIIAISAKYDQAGVTVSVKDNGVGIPIERLDKLFRIDASESTPGTANEKGTGLGLILCKEFVERNDGIIWAESIVGAGSVFSFTIPDNAKQAESSESKQSNALAIIEETRKLKILVVDDDDVSEILLHKSIRKISREILQADTGLEAVAIAKNNPDIDLILMDLRMPQMGGYEATQHIRQFNKDVIIIAQTAYVLLNDREKALEAGFNDYIEKPISKEKILELIHKYFMDTEPPSSFSAT